MQSIITAYDGEGMLEKRMEVGPRHLEHLSNEPYMQEHVWERVNVEVMNVVLVNGEKVQ